MNGQPPLPNALFHHRHSERRLSQMAHNRPILSTRRPSIDPARLVPMDKMVRLKGKDNFKVVFIGAGNIMFGSCSDEGPWNHSFRLEHKLGRRLKVDAIIDPNIERAMSVIQDKCDMFVVSAYENTRVFRTLEEYTQAMINQEKPRAFIVGSPAQFRGTMRPGRDVEMQILRDFPGVAIFVEKPVATGPLSEIDDVFTVSKVLSDSGTLCSVGYMLRYLRAVQKMKQIIEDNDLTVMATVARYATAYEAINKSDWWDKSKSHGPIVEQGTHFCDLSRYFGGDVDISSVSAHSLDWDEKAGRLSKMRIDESKISPENRIPRVTAATWKYDNGAVGSFTHMVALQGLNYSCEFEVYTDGYELKLVNPYVQPVLIIRQPGDDHESKLRFPDDDPFFSEISNFVDLVEDVKDSSSSPPEILSSYEDACRSYELSWAIREASERSRDDRLEAVELAEPRVNGTL
ncbi:hypothetical protein EYR36_005214 [Pleurotus pulmonarius]|nr:hypothetical protein EYR36_005214 [Pleurotus pulmonarius]